MIENEQETGQDARQRVDVERVVRARGAERADADALLDALVREVAQYTFEHMSDEYPTWTQSDRDPVADAVVEGMRDAYSTREWPDAPLPQLRKRLAEVEQLRDALTDMRENLY